MKKMNRMPGCKVERARKIAEANAKKAIIRAKVKAAMAAAKA